MTCTHNKSTAPAHDNHCISIMDLSSLRYNYHTINIIAHLYASKREVSIMLCYQICPPHYAAVQTKNCTSATKVATMKNTDDFHYERELSHAATK